VLVRQQESVGYNHDETMDAMYCIDRVIEEIKCISAESIAKDMEDTSTDMFHQGRHSESLMIMEQRVEVLMKSKGEDDPDTLIAQHNMALSLSKLDRHDQSFALFEKVLMKVIFIMGEDDSSTLMAMHGVADELRYEDSLTMFEEVVKRRSRGFGADDTDTLDTMNTLACVLSNLKRHDESLTMLETVYEKRSRRLGDNS